MFLANLFNVEHKEIAFHHKIKKSLEQARTKIMLQDIIPLTRADIDSHTSYKVYDACSNVWSSIRLSMVDKLNEIKN